MLTAPPIRRSAAVILAMAGTMLSAGAAVHADTQDARAQTAYAFAPRAEYRAAITRTAHANVAMTLTGRGQGRLCPEADGEACSLDAAQDPAQSYLYVSAAQHLVVTSYLQDRSGLWVDPGAGCWSMVPGSPPMPALGQEIARLLAPTRTRGTVRRASARTLIWTGGRNQRVVARLDARREHLVSLTIRGLRTARTATLKVSYPPAVAPLRPTPTC